MNLLFNFIFFRRAKPDPPQRGWSEFAAASKRGKIGGWGPRSGPTEPRLFEAIAEFARRPWD